MIHEIEYVADMVSVNVEKPDHRGQSSVVAIPNPGIYIRDTSNLTSEKGWTIWWYCFKSVVKKLLFATCTRSDDPSSNGVRLSPSQDTVDEEDDSGSEEATDSSTWEWILDLWREWWIRRVASADDLSDALLLVLALCFSSLYFSCTQRVLHCRCVRPGIDSAIRIQHLPYVWTPARSKASSGSLHFPFRTVGSNASVQRAWHWIPVLLGMRCAILFQGIGCAPSSPSGMLLYSCTAYRSTASSCCVHLPLYILGLEETGEHCGQKWKIK
jgi:hypothetical protein